MPWIVGVSGASGTPYAAAVLRALLDAGESVDLVVSRASRLTLLEASFDAPLPAGAFAKPSPAGPQPVFAGGAHSVELPSTNFHA